MDGKHPALGKKGKEVWAEIWAFIGPLISQVIATGDPVWFEDQLVPFYRNGRMENIYWKFSYSPVIGDHDNIEGVIVVCSETTANVDVLKKLTASRARFQNLVTEATVGIIVLTGEQLQVDIVNEAYGKLIDKTPQEPLGKALFDVIPEGLFFWLQVICIVRNYSALRSNNFWPVSMQTKYEENNGCR